MQSFFINPFFDTAGTAKDAGLPNIVGDVGTPFKLFYSSTGAFLAYSASYHNFAEQSSAGTYSNLKFLASRSNAIYGNADTVQPDALTIRPIIRYI